jgi:lysozyme
MPDIHLQSHAGKYAVAALASAWIAIAISVVTQLEGVSTVPYRDSVGVLTICDGATAADGVDFSKTYTKADCQAMLSRDLPKYDIPLQRCLKPEVYNALPPHRHAALVSLSYNIGGGALCKSSVVRELNSNNVAVACDDFLRFNMAGGHVLQGLTNRRETERKLCLEEN